VAPASAGRFDDAELSLLVDRAQFQPFRSGQRLVGEGEHIDSVMVLLLGSASFERWSVEVGEGGVLGAHEFFGVPSLSAASAVVAKGDGVLAGWTTLHLTELMAHDGPLMTSDDI
jgi:CRP-like cAMP-binding protein